MASLAPSQTTQRHKHGTFSPSLFPKKTPQNTTYEHLPSSELSWASRASRLCHKEPKEAKVTSESPVSSQLGIRRMGDLMKKGLKLGETGSSSDSGRCSPKIWSKIRLGANQEKKGLRIRGLWMVISIGERWRSLANNCAAVPCRERGQLYTRAAGLAFHPPEAS